MGVYFDRGRAVVGGWMGGGWVSYDPVRLDLPQRRMERHVYFDGVAAVLLEPGRGLTAAAYPRRTGATAIGGD